METIIGTTVKNTIMDAKVAQEYAAILNHIVVCEIEDELRIRFKALSFIYFEVGFGGSHMWVKQVGYLNDNKNLIQVNF